MKATHKSTVHQSVVTLVRRQGYSPIEAERQWDSIYSKQYEQAAPGTTHTWKIGQYDFEFTKVVEGRNIDLAAVVSECLDEARERENEAVILGWFRLASALSVIVILIALIYLTTTVFEDGSFIFLGLIKGCLPWGICS